MLMEHYYRAEPVHERFDFAPSQFTRSHHRSIRLISPCLPFSLASQDEAAMSIGSAERAFSAYLILAFVNNTLSINMVIILCRILLYSCTRYWISYIIIDDNHCSKEIHEAMIFISSGR
jgi:hypothetical protein